MEAAPEIIAPNGFTDVLVMNWREAQALVRRVGSEYRGWVLDDVRTMPARERVRLGARVAVKATWTRKRVWALVPGGWRCLYPRVSDVD